MGGDADFGGEASESGCGQRLGLSVRPVVGGGNVLGSKLTVADALTEEVGAEVDVFAGVEGGGVLGLCEGGFIVNA